VAEELASLLERIQKDGVEKAEAEAARILQAAREQADAALGEARVQAERLRADAQRDADASAERGRKTLEQAARDVVLSVADGVDALLRRLAQTRVKDALSGDALRQIVLEVVKSYAAAGPAGAPVEALVPPPRQKEIADLFLTALASELRGGVEVRGDGSVTDGFRVFLKGDRVEHDFSTEAIAESLCRLVRPHLAEIVRSATAGSAAAQGPKHA
jgi:V/A-type H+-transporting ATPase subunit E